MNRSLRDLSVAKGESVGEIVCFYCSVRVLGTATGDVVAIGGDIEVGGTVKGDVAACGGRVRLLQSAHVEGDVNAIGGPIEAHAEAIVRGERDAFPYLHVPGQRRPHLPGLLGLSAGNLLLAGLGAVLFRSARSRNAGLAVRTRPVVSTAAGCGLLVLWVVLLSLNVPNAWVLSLHWIGNLLFLAMLYCGYTALAWTAGGLLVRSGPAWAQWVAGSLVLSAGLLTPVAGGLVFVAVLLLGLGAALVSGMGRDRGPTAGKAQAHSAP